MFLGKPSSVLGVYSYGVVNSVGLSRLEENFAVARARDGSRGYDRFVIVRRLGVIGETRCRDCTESRVSSATFS